jgi:ATP-binding protein involved in chromosome partitioning
MIGRMIQQFVDDVLWGDLDILVVDLPPGTGDAQLTLTQLLPLSGAVVVSTPQDVALADAIKGINMFQKVSVPVLGVVENMSYFECPQCHHQAHIFSHAGAKNKAEELGVDFLGELPLEEATRMGADQGKPIVAKEPESAQTKRFKAMAEKIVKTLAVSSEKKAPSFTSSLPGMSGAPRPGGFTV